LGALAIYCFSFLWLSEEGVDIIVSNINTTMKGTGRVQEFTEVAAITEYLSVVKFTASDNLYALFFAAGKAGTAETIQFEAKNKHDAIFKGAMLAKEKGFI